MRPTPSKGYVVVETNKGAVRGIWRAHSAAFLGVPFAEPPYGDLRFLPPQPRAPWTGSPTRSTTRPRRSARRWQRSPRSLSRASLAWTR